jgi:Protein of unknown function (DUF3048) N-terminal domain/Protein of unknown function (DUF3048) C-terminal domain
MKRIVLFFILAGFIASCTPEPDGVALAATTAVDPPPVVTETIAATVAVVLTEPSAAPAPGRNPLTGLVVENPALLERRPILVKIQNVPRESRPQWGLSLADIVYEYYIEYGDTRFAALYYGNDSHVGPIRSARHVDMQLVQMYEALFIFGGAYDDLFELLLNSNFADRLIREGPNTAAALTRLDPYGVNYLMADTRAVEEVIALYGMDNRQPDLTGMTFSVEPPQGAQTGTDLFVRFSGGMYSHWQYDSSRGGYLRFSDAENDFDRDNPVYVQQYDRQTEEPILAENVVIILAPYAELSAETETSAGVYDVDLLGKGDAFLARDGSVQAVFWQREEAGDVMTLVDGDGNAVPFKPGRTWFELMGKSSQVLPNDGAWQFNFLRP